MPRAQTTLDFLIGTTVFLLTLSAVLVTLPGMVDPFATGSESHTIVADRSAERLSADLLVASPGKPFVFETDAVTAFFGQPLADARDDLAVQSHVEVNVTLSNETHRLHSTGPSVPGSADSSVAWRSGRYQGEYAELVVRVW